jgi:hypothetical protein
MRKRFLTLVAMTLIFLSTSGAQAYVETFDSNNANWSYGFNNNFSTILPATHVSSGGNPGGYITGATANLYAVWTYATALYGDITGQMMTIDTKVGVDSAAGNAQFYVGKGGAYFIDGTWNIGADLNWTTHTVALDATHFTRWTGVDTGAFTLDQVLAAPDDIGIFFGGGLASGSVNLMVDNFGTVATVPVPAAAWLLGSGIVGLAALRRKLQK